MQESNKEGTKPSFYLYQGNGGPWCCGVCETNNFDLRRICLSCQKGIRPPFRAKVDWPCLEVGCCYYVNSHKTGSCLKCGTIKWEPPLSQYNNNQEK